MTIKYGQGYEQTWVVFHGLPEEVREDLVSYFDLTSVSDTTLTLSDLVVNATSIAHAVGAVASTLGGTVVASTADAPPASTASPEGVDAWSQARSTQARSTQVEPSEQPSLLTLIEQASTVRALERLWMENQEAFADSSIMAAWKAQGRKLNGAT